MLRETARIVNLSAMKDEISEQDIRKALVEQLRKNGHDTAPITGEKQKSRKSREIFSQKRKHSSKPSGASTSAHIAEETEKKKDNVPSKSTVIQRTLRPPPRVIVFEEPGKSKGTGKNVYNSKRNTSEDDTEDFNFLEMANDVKEFGMTGFSKKERRKFEQQKAQALGAKAPKGVKMPYRILMAHHKIQKQKETKRYKLEVAMGMAAKKNKKQKKEKPTSSQATSGWWTDNSSKGIDLTTGKYKRGVQTLSKDDIKRIQGKRKK